MVSRMSLDEARRPRLEEGESERKNEVTATQNLMHRFMGRKLKVFASECSLIATSAYFIDFMSFHQPSISKDHAMASRN